MYPSERFHRPQCLRTVARLCVAFALLGSAVWLTGCASIPTECITETIGTDELSAHVHFLAQPALKGRKPKTRGSKLARRYIARRFADYGLVPWGQATRFAQPFGLGTNVIGVLPGTDPNFAEEVVIVSAHYDHLGKTDKGLCLGACDNASGVAALLEIAEYLALIPERPRRSICFAAFDCEETFTLGAFAFTCRDDFDQSRIAGVVNIDMLGRRGFEILGHHLFMTGTNRYPDLRRRIQSRVPEGLVLLPVGTEIAGPRGDHIVFETTDVPVLFFSCGPHEDYHRPADTPEKLDYERIGASVAVIAGAVEALANSPDRYHRDLSENADIEELKAVELCLSKIREDHDVMGWSEIQARQFDPVIDQVERLLRQPRYTQQDRLRLLRTAAIPMIPLAIWPESTADPSDPNQPDEVKVNDFMIGLQTLFTEHRALFIRAAQSLVKDLLSRRAGFLLGRTINETVVVTEVPDHLIFVEDSGSSRHRLEFLHLTLSIGAHINDPAGVGVSVHCSVIPTQRDGTKEELTDYCLLVCRRQVHRGDDSMWVGVLKHVTGSSVKVSYEQALQARLAEGQWANEHAWIRDCAASENPQLRHIALATLPKVLGRDAEPVLLDVLADPNASAIDRQAVVWSLGPDSTTNVMFAVAEMLSDQTRIKHRQQRYWEILSRPDTPFEGYPLLPIVLRGLEEWLHEHAETPRTMADYAHERLGVATRQSLPKDTSVWRRWIEQNWSDPAD